MEYEIVEFLTMNPGMVFDKERIYERFYRADKARSAEGSGLGLAIVKEAVEALSGQIVVTSPYKNGTKFTLTLPLFLT